MAVTTGAIASVRVSTAAPSPPISPSMRTPVMSGAMRPAWGGAAYGSTSWRKAGPVVPWTVAVTALRRPTMSSTVERNDASVALAVALVTTIVMVS